MACRHVTECFVELRVDEHDRRTRVLDDVAHLVRVEAEVDGDDDSAVPRDREQSGQHAGTVLRDDRDPLAEADAEGVEPRSHRSGADGDLAPGERAPARRRLIGLVDDADAVAEDELGAVQEVEDVERRFHGSSGHLGPMSCPEHRLLNFSAAPL